MDVGGYLSNYSDYALSAVIHNMRTNREYDEKLFANQAELVNNTTMNYSLETNKARVEDLANNLGRFVDLYA